MDVIPLCDRVTAAVLRCYLLFTSSESNLCTL